MKDYNKELGKKLDAIAARLGDMNDEESIDELSETLSVVTEEDATEKERKDTRVN